MVTILIAALAAQAAGSSVYTPLNPARCTIVEERPEEEGFTRWRCPGHGATPLFVSSGEGRYDIDAGVDSGQFEFFHTLNRPAPRVEWRPRGGRPGCRIATVDGTLPDANELARAAADRAPRFRCGVDQPEVSTNGL